MKHLLVEQTEGTHGLAEAALRDLLGAEVELGGADGLGSQASRRGAKVLGALGDVAPIPSDRVGRVVASLPVFEQASTSERHGADDRHDVTPRVRREAASGAALPCAMAPEESW